MKRFAVEGLLKAFAVFLTMAATGSVWAQNPNTTATGNANQQLIQQYAIPNEPSISPTQLLQLLQQNIKYIFVFYQENRSFDHYFGTFPGAEGIYSNSPAQTAGVCAVHPQCWWPNILHNRALPAGPGNRKYVSG